MDEREQKIKEIDNKIEIISKMALKEFLKYSNWKTKKIDESNSDKFFIYCFIRNRRKIKKIRRNKKIKYNLKIKF